MQQIKEKYSLIKWKTNNRIWWKITNIWTYNENNNAINDYLIHQYMLQHLQMKSIRNAKNNYEKQIYDIYDILMNNDFEDFAWMNNIENDFVNFVNFPIAWNFMWWLFLKIISFMYLHEIFEMWFFVSWNWQYFSWN